MMQCLIDTCVLLWYGVDDQQLSRRVKAIIDDPQNNIRISIASFWEIAIKQGLAKLPATSNLFALEAETKRLSIDILPLSIKALHEVTVLPKEHKDPFDRIIAATAITEGDILLTCDAAFDLFNVTRIW